MKDMRRVAALLSVVLALFGCRRNDSFDEIAAHQTEGEKRAASERRPPGWVYVKILNSEGRVLEEGWEFTKPPDRFEEDGLSRLRPYIKKLVASDHWFTSVVAGTLDYEQAMSVSNMEGVIEYSHSFDIADEQALEKEARSICLQKGYVVLDESVSDDVRNIRWNLPNDVEPIMELLSIFAERILRIPKSAGLEIQYEEHKDDRNKYDGEKGIEFYYTHPIEDPTAPPPN